MVRLVPIQPSRVEATETADGLLVEMVRRRPWWRWVAPLWIALVMTFGLVQMLTGEPPENSGGNWFLVLWAALGLALISLSLWALLYREQVLVATDALVHTRAIGPLRRQRAYNRHAITDVRISPATTSAWHSNWSSYGIGGGTVAFDYGDRTVRVADVDEAEAKRVVAGLADAGVS
jgi:hypothetical protein